MSTTALRPRYASGAHRPVPCPTCDGTKAQARASQCLRCRYEPFATRPERTPTPPRAVQPDHTAAHTLAIAATLARTRAKLLTKVRGSPSRAAQILADSYEAEAEALLEVRYILVRRLGLLNRQRFALSAQAQP